MTEPLKLTTKRARKDHPCTWCGLEIHPGIEYHEVRLDGETCHYHEDCYTEWSIGEFGGRDEPEAREPNQ